MLKILFIRNTIDVKLGPDFVKNYQLHPHWRKIAMHAPSHRLAAVAGGYCLLATSHVKHDASMFKKAYVYAETASGDRLTRTDKNIVAQM